MGFGSPLIILDFNEKIQTKFAKSLAIGSTYCFKTKVLLSKNAGYAINHMGVLFSKESITFKDAGKAYQPTISFKKGLDNSIEWKELCGSFVANREEFYMTIGRFQHIDDVSPSQRMPDRSSQLDINRSAYYLFDDFQLYEVEIPSECGCNEEEIVVPVGQTLSNFEKKHQEIKSGRFILNNVLFDFNETEIRDLFKSELKDLLNYLKSDLTLKAIIHGFTDNKREEDYNLKLSTQRAKAVAQWLIDSGINKSRISYQGHGSANPINSNKLEAYRESNRRVEVEFLNEKTDK